MSLETVSRWLRRPEYTGENRCLHCTVVNLSIAAVTSGLVWIVSPRVAGITFTASMAVIYFRGYLIPGTPTLAKQYLPERLLAQFKEFSRTDEYGRGLHRAVDIEKTLADAGVVVECDESEDLCLDEAVRSTWRDEMRTMSEEAKRTAAVARILDVDPNSLNLVRGDHGVSAQYRGRTVAQWESEPAAIADAAGASVLRGTLDEWSSTDPTIRAKMLMGLRLFLDTCPACSGRISLTDETVETCCRSNEAVTASCEGCSERLFVGPAT